MVNLMPSNLTLFLIVHFHVMHGYAATHMHITHVHTSFPFCHCHVVVSCFSYFDMPFEDIIGRYVCIKATAYSCCKLIQLGSIHSPICRIFLKDCFGDCTFDVLLVPSETNLPCSWDSSMSPLCLLIEKNCSIGWIIPKPLQELLNETWIGFPFDGIMRGPLRRGIWSRKRGRSRQLHRYSSPLALSFYRSNA